MSNSISSKAIIIVTNRLGVALGFPSNSFAIMPDIGSAATYYGECIPINATNGVSIICNATLNGYAQATGTELSPRFTLRYKICQGPLCQAQVFNTTGSANVYVSPYSSSSSINIVKLGTNTQTGTIFINGIGYSSNTNIVFLNSISYQISAAPPSGMGFVSWSATNVIVGNALAETTTAVASNSGTLTASFG